MGALPSKLKNMIIFNEGVSLAGQTGECTLPKLARKTEGWRGGGMNSEAEVALGLEGDPFEWSVGGLALQAIRQFGITQVDGVMLRFAGAYQSGTSAIPDAVEVIIRGFHKEIDHGSQKPGDDTETKITTAWTYFKYSCNGRVEYEIDKLNMIEIFDGVDTMALQRAALGI